VEIIEGVCRYRVRIGAWFAATIELQDQNGMADQASNAAPNKTKKSNGNGSGEPQATQWNA
jgi:hypothetical protein